MKANPDNYNFVCSSNTKVNITVEKQKISNNAKVKYF